MDSTKKSVVLLVFLFLGCAVYVFFCSGCKSKKQQQQKIRIGFLVKRPEEAWFQNEWKFAQKCADDYGFELIKIGTPDGEKVLSAIDNLAAQGCQGFVVCTPDVHLGPAIVARANSYEMKVYTVDDQFVGPDGNFMDVPYLGCNALAIGRLVGKSLYEEFQRRQWRIEESAACCVTFDELDTAKQRTDGATEALVESGFPADKIYRVPEKTTDVPGAFDAANTVITQHPEVKKWLVFSINDEGVMGSVRALEGRGFDENSIIGVGIGGSTCLVEFEKEKPTGFFATALISPFRHGYETTENLYKWLKYGIEPPKIIRTDAVIINRKNYKQGLKEQGLMD